MSDSGMQDSAGIMIAASLFDLVICSEVGACNAVPRIRKFGPLDLTSSRFASQNVAFARTRASPGASGVDTL